MPTSTINSLLAVVAIRVGAATVAVVDETSGRHPVGLCARDTVPGSKMKQTSQTFQQGIPP